MKKIKNFFKKALTYILNRCTLILSKEEHTEGENKMYKDFRYINAGTNEIYRYGHKAIERVQACLEANENGFYSIPADGGKYWTLGTSEGKFGEFIKWGDTFFSVNRGGFAYAKAGTDKGEKFVEFLNSMIAKMNEINDSRFEKEEE